MELPLTPRLAPPQPPEVEALMKRAAEREEVVSFAGGLPAEDLFPRAALAEALARVMAEDGRTALQYQWAEGYGPLREQIAALMRQRGIVVGPEEIVVTHGAQQALDLLARLLLRPGDALGIESPTYVAAIQVLRLQGPRMLPLARDERGLDLDALGRGEPRLLYLAPTGHNPTGGALDDATCDALLAWAAAHGACIVEDDAYGAVQLDRPRRPLRARDGAADRVIYVGTFSKILSPGLRVGWVVAPRPVTELLVRLKGVVDLQTSTLVQMALSRYLAEHDLAAHVARCLGRYRERRDALLAALARHMPDQVRWTRPTAGFSVWLTLPRGCVAAELLAPAVAAGVAFEPGAAFFPDAPRHEHLRLSFSNLRPDDIAAGVARLGEVLRRPCPR